MRGSLSTTNARAEPEPQSSVGLGLSFGVLARVNGLALAGIDGTWRHGEATWLHLAAAGSVSFADYISSVLEVRAGLEHRRVRCGWGCLYGGIDLALLDADIHDGPGPASGHARSNSGWASRIARTAASSRTCAWPNGAGTRGSWSRTLWRIGERPETEPVGLAELMLAHGRYQLAGGSVGVQRRGHCDTLG